MRSSHPPTPISDTSRGGAVRVGEAGKAAALARGAKPMVMNGRQMKGFVWVGGKLDLRAVKSWLSRARAFVETIPAKESSAKPRRSKRSES